MLFRSRVFEITTANVAIYNCTFANNHVWGDGAVIYTSQGDNLTVVDCIFANNSATLDGVICNWVLLILL